MNDANKTQQVPIASDFPAFLSTIYLVTKPSPKLVETVPRIEGAFNMWGKTIAPSPPGEFAFFTAPLAYPFKFSKDGIHLITEALKEIPEVDKKSISLKTFPNILASDRTSYPDIFSEDLVVEEQYIAFRLKNWNSVEFKMFPTFVVLSFDYSTSLVDSPEEYQKISEYWRERIQAFNNNYKLKETLGIHENRVKSWDVPVLTFISVGFCHHIKYFNRYFGGGSGDKKGLFLTEVSPRPSMAKSSRLTGLYPLMHEYDSFTRWRFYYSPEPFFYTGHWRRSTYPGGTHGPRAKLDQLLRIALFIHVVMPNIGNQCQADLSELEQNFLALQERRIAFLDQFSSSDLEGFQQVLTNIIGRYRNISSKSERADEILLGLNNLKLFVNSAFEVKRMDNFESKEQAPEGIFPADLALEFFHFQPNAVFHDDRGTSNRYRRLIRQT